MDPRHCRPGPHSKAMLQFVLPHPDSGPLHMGSSTCAVGSVSVCISDGLGSLCMRGSEDDDNWVADAGFTVKLDELVCVDRPACTV